MTLKIFALAALTAFTLTGFLHADHKCCERAVVGAWLSEPYETFSIDSETDDIRARLFIFNSDNTLITYQSNSYSLQNSSGFQLTPSFGVWRCDEKGLVKAVVFDFFNFAVDYESESEALDSPNALEISLWDDNSPDIGSFVPGEYDRTMFKFRFFHKHKDKYTYGIFNERLQGIANDVDPLDSDVEPTVEVERSNVAIRRINLSAGDFTGLDYPSLIN